MKIPVDQSMVLVQKLCEENSIRLTTQRKIVATFIYRILEFFIELRIAYRLDTINKFIACQHISQESENRFPIFVICVHCNEVSELSVPYSIMQNMSTLVNTPHFKVISSKIELKGVCKKCEYDSNLIIEGEHCEQTF
jgi:Fur family zinc uptake transcriptional regulator